MWPRALGHRSILADPRSKDMKDIINKRIKHREWFRPFAPSIMEEFFHKYFYCKNNISPYMLLAVKWKKIAIKNILSVIHVDNTSRVQTVSQKTNLRYFQLSYWYRFTSLNYTTPWSFKYSTFESYKEFL